MYAQGNQSQNSEQDKLQPDRTNQNAADDRNKGYGQEVHIKSSHVF